MNLKFAFFPLKLSAILDDIYHTEAIIAVSIYTNQVSLKPFNDDLQGIKRNMKVKYPCTHLILKLGVRIRAIFKTEG